jgi:hypothetical protein
VSEKMTAKEVWVKDARHNAYLESQGFVVIRFWEREIKENIDKCIELIRSRSRRQQDLESVRLLLSGDPSLTTYLCEDSIASMSYDIFRSELGKLLQGFSL